MELLADTSALGVGEHRVARWVAAGMCEAVVEPLEGEYFARVPAVPGAWACESTSEIVLSTLREVLEGWAILKLEFGHDDIPAFGGIDLRMNP